jgi:uncharacterized protein with HEPN domain
MSEEVFDRAWRAYYLPSARLVDDGDEPRAEHAYLPLRPTPKPIGLVTDLQRPHRPIRTVFPTPWEVLELDDPGLAPRIDEVERCSGAIAREIVAWSRNGFREPLPPELRAAADAYRSSIAGLVGPLLPSAQRKLSDFTRFLPSEAYAALKRAVIFDKLREAVHGLIRVHQTGERRFREDPEVRDATLYRLMIVGQCAKDTDVSAYLGIDWTDLKGLRDIIAKGYPSGMRLDIIWAKVEYVVAEVAPRVGAAEPSEAGS